MRNINAPRSLQEHNVAVNMARISLKAMAPGDERIPAAKEKLRKANEAFRIFKYRAHSMSPNGQLIRH